MYPGLVPTAVLGISLQGHLYLLAQPGWQGCMFPSCLPLLFNAKVLAKDTFLLLLHPSIQLCTVGQLPAPLLRAGLATWLKA